MPVGDFEGWRTELLAMGRIVLAGEGGVTEEEAVRRFDRYLELADMVDGSEGPAAVRALIASLQVDQDYGAYQAGFGALERFPSMDLARGVALAAAEVVSIPSGNSGQVLLLLADSDAEAVREFNAAGSQMEPAVKDQLSALIAEHERDEWLDGEPCGRLRVG
ncbi:hypothetical protein [Streptomyces sp. NRRL S-1813]|uniref:hypothetical protein n=1 Tax=Streptomyces sp. NRRL S-1813 TaxID=1463888 RepID=UPI00131E6ADB|nr:hypothetical protein [Streptomyces sp. NRRL S-1813]